MPPSPSLRRSPAKDPHGDSHKRGRSLESGLSFKGRSLEGGLSFKERDDDLTLFNELQNKETDNFLLQSNDDFEDILSSKVNSFPDLKLGINIPVRGESSDLLNADDDKNDYEWLLTPPETPLFPSLDDEPAPANIVHNGRARSRPTSISRSSTMERSQRSSRGSPSPQRSSPSPRSGSSTFQGRPSSAPQSSPIPLRPTTPSRRPSPPPVKPSTPPPRSLTPTSRRTAAGSSAFVAASGISGTSPVRTNCGNSASPKIMAWQSNIPGFSLEAPPNLRTSLADRPASYVRGSSPASRSSRGRQSMSPTATRSISSSHSQERDRLSSHSKGSIASSGDDDTESLQSTPLSVTERPMSRKGVSGFSCSRPSAYSKKPIKTMSPSSAPKRSFDSAIRQMDRKSPQNMFRPLLSSVPSSTYYAGKVSTAHRSLISRNSSVTTSSNASSDLAISGAHDTEDDGASENATAPFSDVQDEVFAFEKMDAASENTGHGHNALSGFSEPDKGCAFASNAGDITESNANVCATEAVAMDVENDFVKINRHENVLLCRRCGSEYHPNELAENEDNICFECKKKEELSSNPSLLVRLETTHNASAPSMNVSEESHVTYSRMAPGNADLMDSSLVAFHDENAPKDEDQVGQPKGNLNSSLSRSTEEESMQMVCEQKITEEHETVNDDQSHMANSLQEMHKCRDQTNRNINTVEGAGISVLLLNRSSSLKGPVIHGRTIDSSGAISYDDLSYARDLTSSMRSSVGHGSISTTSSTDLTSARHGEMVVQRQFSGKRSDVSSKHLSTGSSTSLPVYQGFGVSTSSHDGSCEGSISNMRHIAAGERLGSPSEQVVAVDMIELHDAVPPVSQAAVAGEDNSGTCTSSRETDPSFMSDHIVSSEFEAKSRGSVGTDEGHGVQESGEDLPESIVNVRNVEETAFIESSMAEENTMLENRVDQAEAAEDPVQCCTSTITEIEINDSHPSSPKSQIDLVSREELEDPSSTTHHGDDVKDSSPNSTKSNLDNEIAEESTVTVEERGGRRTRSLTLEEATDTILFCSSIVHDLAYKAASIAVEKEKENLEPLEGSRPMLTIPDRRSSDRKDHPGVTSGRTPKTQKTRKKRAADKTEAKPPLTENEERSNEPVVRSVGIPNNGDTMKPLKLESKCNCTIM